MGNLSNLWLWPSEVNETEFGQAHTPTVRQLVEFLRSEKPFPRKGREWLADMLDPECDTYASLVVERKPGPVPGVAASKDFEMMIRLEELVAEEGKVYLAREKCMAEFGIGETKAKAIWAALKAYREAS